MQSSEEIFDLSEIHVCRETCVNAFTTSGVLMTRENTGGMPEAEHGP